MKAIILAAGRSTRMLPLTEKVPKCLLPFGKKTILEYQIRLLRENGISKIIVVAGFSANKVMQVGGTEIQYVYNPDYLTTNSIYSLYLAKDYLDSDLILLNSDMIIHSKLMKKLMTEQHPNAILIDYGKKLSDGEMNVITKNEYLKKIGKNIHGNDADGESVQVCKFDKKSAFILKKELIRLINQNHIDKFPAFAFMPIIKSERIKGITTEGLKWFEIDYKEDYFAACNEIKYLG